MSYKIETLENDLTVILEEIPHLGSVAYHLSIPGGYYFDNPDQNGASLILSELTSRGSGEYSSREFSNTCESFGLRHSEYSGGDRFVYSGQVLATYLDHALRMTSLMVQEPHLSGEEIDPIRDVLLQDIRGVEDQPAQKASQEFRKRYFPDPVNRSNLGTEEGLKNCKETDLKELWQKMYCSTGAILSISGKFDISEVEESVSKYFANWKSGEKEVLQVGTDPGQAEHWIESDTAQAQIIAACRFPSFDSGHYYAGKVLNGILSGGMAGRLFLEVREKRGLCYSVFSRYSADRYGGVMLAAAGTTPERAQETADVLLAELRKVKSGILEEELIRAKTTIKSSLIIGEESAASRAAGNAHDWWLWKRVRPLEEVLTAIEQITENDILSMLEEYPLEDFTFLSLGPAQLEYPGGNNE